MASSLPLPPPSPSSSPSPAHLPQLSHHSPATHNASPPAAHAADALVRTLLGTTEPSDTYFHPDSVLTQLLQFAAAPDAHLDPNPSINRALTRLVHILQARLHPVQAHAPPRPKHLAPPPLHRPSFACLERQACAIIDADPELLRRANLIRTVATRAESRMENFYVQLLLPPANDTAAAPHAPPPASPPGSYTARIQAAARPFPYVANYASMVDAEARVLQALLHPRRARDCHVVFCGSGPLPLTGLLLAARMRCAVTLVDNDARAVALSLRLVRHWEERHIIPQGRVSVLRAECHHIFFLPRDAPADAAPQAQPGRIPALEGDIVDADADASSAAMRPTLRCDVIFIAALVPNAAKEEVASKAAANAPTGHNPPFVVLRSAHGLTARLAYFRTRRSLLTRYMPHVATMVPETHEDGLPDIVDDDESPFAYFPSDILNSLEIYGGDERTKKALGRYHHN